ncbi:hypothetical protein NQZ68_037717 [Dissostichus eleginoides]|nr:hypothetical protein NQZ68_037717 [Dissostichus eleginoides]
MKANLIFISQKHSNISDILSECWGGGEFSFLWTELSIGQKCFCKSTVDGGGENVTKAELDFLFLQLDLLQGLPLIPFHLYLTLHLDRDKDCHLGRLQGADCSATEQTCSFSKTLFPSDSWGGGALSHVTPNKESAHSLSLCEPQILLTSLHKHHRQLSGLC